MLASLASACDVRISKKTTMLLCLLTSHRCQTLPKLDTALMQELPGKIVFTIGDKLKTTRQRKHLAPIELLVYPRDESICVVSHLKQYIARTQPTRATHDTKLLISYAKPHKPISNSTVLKWAKSVLWDSAIDTGTFSGNSVRPASPSVVRCPDWPNSRGNPQSRRLDHSPKLCQALPRTN